MAVMLPPEPEAAGGQKEEEDIGNDKRVSDNPACGLCVTSRLGWPPKIFLIVVVGMLQ